MSVHVTKRENGAEFVTDVSCDLDQFPGPETLTTLRVRQELDQLKKSTFKFLP